MVSEEGTLPQRERSQFLRPADRRKVIARVAATLQARHYPRLALSGILTAAALAGFLTSFLLLTLGLTTMAARYALAALVAYLAFLGFIRLWVTRYLGDQSADGSLLDLAPDPAPGGGPGFEFGGGGQFSGGGAGRSFETGSDVLDRSLERSCSTPSSPGRSTGACDSSLPSTSSQRQTPSAISSGQALLQNPLTNV